VVRAIWKFLRNNDAGQDLAEYCLLTALIALVAMGILYHMAGGIDGIWGSVNASINGGTVSSTARTPAH